MLVKAPLIREGLEKLHQEIEYFFQQLPNAKRWSSKLFQKPFYQQVIAQNPGLKKRLKTFWEEYQKLSPEIRNLVCKEFIVSVD